MAIQIGVVKAMTGSVTATAADGSIRNLQVGDRIFANELISTGADGAIEIEFADGRVMDLGRNSQAMLDSNMYDPQAPATATVDGETVPDDVAAIQQALLAGEDPTLVGEATAAGAGVEGGNEGHEPVFVDYLNPAIIPEAGFDTIGVTNEYDLPEEDIIILEEEDGSPSTGGTDVFVDEDDLGSEFELAFIGPSAIISAFEIDTGFIAQLPLVFGNNDEAPGDDLPPDSSTTQTGKLNASFGINGPGAVKFNPEGAQPGGLTSGGEPVLFWVSADGALLVGYILTTPDYDFEYDYVQEYGDYAEVIFTAELDPLTMNFAFTLHGPLDHPNGSTEDNLLINLSYVVSDSDGDTANGILKINVDDDSPLVELAFNEKTEAPLSLIVDESEGTDGSVKDEPGFADNDDEVASADPTDIGFATLSGDVLFDVDVSPGADGENYAARSFALTLTLPGGESAVDSGLDATDGGDIMLSWETVGSVIVGTDEDGHVVFRISIDASTGDVTVSQYEAIHHGDDDNDHDALLTIGEGLIGANVTVFDNDGDSATSGDVDLGSLIGFEDDGPDQTVSANDEAAAALVVELDETEGDDRGNAAIPEVADGNSDDAGPGLAQVTTAVTGGLAALFTASGSYGSDGAGMVSDSLSFIGVPDEGLATSLSATDGGLITLFLEGGDLVGRDSDNHIVFTVAIVESPADSGEFQLQTTLFEAIDHGDDGNLFDSVTQLLLTGDGEVQLQYQVTRTDGDGDEVTDSDAITLINANGSVFNFDDDGPVQTVTANAEAAAALVVELDESEGADRANATLFEVADGNPDDAGPGLAQVTTAVSGGLVTLFTASGDDGSDGAGIVSGTLSFVGVPDEGLATSLSATDGGPITVFLEGGDLVGRDGDNDPVFTIRIIEFPADSGEYQLQTTLFEAIDHGDDGNLFDSVTQLLLAEAGEVQLQYAVTRTDGDGDEVIAADQITLFDQSNSVFGFDDDGPVAMDDSGNVSEGSTLVVPAGSGVLVNDDSGSDGYDGAIVGVVTGNDAATDTINGNVGFSINGLYGMLTLNADGSYTYESTANAIDANAQDQFVYTIRDGDGDLTSAVLTINIADVTAEPTNTLGTVDEAGLAAGGNVPADGTDEPLDSETFNGNLTLQPGWTAVASSGSTLLGDYQVNADGTFSYTLTSVTDDVGGAETDSFTYTADDGNGNTVINTVTITIIDDEPVAMDDSGNVTEGATLNVLAAAGVLTNDQSGADGYDGAIVGVVTGNDAATDTINGNVGFSINGLYGMLTLNADGSYTYESTANAIDANAQDQFVYTIRDGDGDLTSAVLTINIADVTAEPTNTLGTVDEAGLAAGGNVPADGTDEPLDSETFNGNLTLQPGWTAVASSGSTLLGDYQVNADGTFSYTLTSVTDDVGGAETDSFTYTADDGNGNTVINTVTITIIDDEPVAMDDSGNVTEGATLNVLAAAGVLTNDQSGADGYDGAIVGVVTGNDAATDTINGNVGFSINGLYGMLTLNADGSYTYESTANAIDANAQDQFVYTIRDGDGDLTSAVLTINVADVTGVPEDTAAEVDEAGISPLGTSAGDGSNQVVGGSLSFSGGFDNVALQNGATALGTWTVYADGTFDYTLNVATDDLLGDETDSFSYTATDDNGNSVTNTVTITIIDDEPVFTIVNDGGDIDDVVSLITQNPTADMTYFGNFADWAYGADDFGSLSASSLPAGVQVDSIAVDGSQIVLNFYEGEVLVATLTLNADGQDSLDVFRREPEVEFIPVATAAAEAGGPEGSVLVDLNAAADFNILVTATKGGVVDDVNPSSQGWGVDNQNINTDETITFSFVDDDDDISPYGISDFKFQVTKWTGGFNGAIAITVVFIDADTMIQSTETLQFSSVEGAVITITELNWLNFEAGDELLSVKMQHGNASSGGAFNINGVEVGAESVTPPADLSYEGIVIDIVDGDGDVDSQEFSLAIDGDTGDGLTVEATTGTSGGDSLMGTAGDDFLIGGAGDDILTGDTGADTFEFSMAYNTGNDEITDFEIGVDTLSFSDVIDDNNDITIDFADVVSSIDNEGAGGDLTIHMTNGGSLTLTGLGTADSITTAAQLETYLGNVNINTDS